MTGFHDPRQHAVAMAFVVPILETARRRKMPLILSGLLRPKRQQQVFNLR